MLTKTDRVFVTFLTVMDNPYILHSIRFEVQSYTLVAYLGGGVKSFVYFNFSFKGTMQLSI